MHGIWRNNACRCHWDAENCSRMTCAQGMEGSWYKDACRCFYKQNSCELKKCPDAHFAAWFRNGCHCFMDFGKKVCPQGYRDVAGTCERIYGSGEVFVGSTTELVPECTPKTKWNGKKCVSICAATMKYDGTKCVCPSGFTFNWTQQKCNPVDCGNTRKYSKT